MARLIETKENEEIGLYTKDSATNKVVRVGEFSPNGGGLVIGSAGIDGASGSEEDNIKLHRGGSNILQLVKGSCNVPDGVLAPAGDLAKLQGVSHSDFIVGSIAQVTSGEATHSSLNSVVSSTGFVSGVKILVVGKTADVVPVVVNQKVFIEGIGSNAEISCNVNLGFNSSKSLVKNVRFLGDLTLDDGSNNNIITDCWIVSTGTVTDNNSNPNNLITILQEV